MTQIAGKPPHGLASHCIAISHYTDCCARTGMLVKSCRFCLVATPVFSPEIRPPSGVCGMTCEIYQGRAGCPATFKTALRCIDMQHLVPVKLWLASP
jgi:hypothetical protein